MSRPALLVFLLLLIVFTSQVEWNQQIINEVEANPTVSRKQQDVLDAQESVKEKIILSQEKSIQKLNKLVQSLQEQLVQCRVINGAVVDTSIPYTELLNELEQQQILEA